MRRSGSSQRCGVAGQEATGTSCSNLKKEFFPKNMVQPWGRAQKGGGISVLGDYKTWLDKPCSNSMMALLWAGDQTGACVSFSIYYIPVVRSSTNAFGALGIKEWPHQRLTSRMLNDMKNTFIVYGPMLGHSHAWSTSVPLSHQLLRMSKYLTVAQEQPTWHPAHDQERLALCTPRLKCL